MWEWVFFIIISLRALLGFCRSNLLTTFESDSGPVALIHQKGGLSQPAVLACNAVGRGHFWVKVGKNRSQLVSKIYIPLFAVPPIPKRVPHRPPF